MLKVIVFGCSNGAEAYSISSVLKNWFSDIEFTIYAYDIDKNMIEKAKSAIYLHEEIFNNKIITDAFVNNTFD